MSNSSYFRRFGACATLLTALGLASCKSDSKTTPNTIAQTIVVVSENNTQSKLLTEIYAQSLEKSGFRVARRDSVADLPAAYAVLKSGAADLFVTHTGELLAYTVKNEPAAASTSTTEAATTTTIGETTTSSTDSSTPPTSPLQNELTPTTLGATSTTVSSAGQASAESINLQTKLIGEILPTSLQIGAASDAEDKNVIACSAAVSKTGSLTSLSDVARAADVLRLAAPAGFKTDTPFGLPGFEKVYGTTFKTFITVEAAKIGEAITPPTTAPPDTSVSTTSTIAATTTVAASTGDTATGDTGATTTTVPTPLSDADCGAFNSLDTTMPVDAVEMGDDKGWIENNGVIPVLTATAYTPAVSQLVDQISQNLTTAALRAMLRQMATKGDSPELMASKYVASAKPAGS